MVVCEGHVVRKSRQDDREGSLGLGERGNVDEANEMERNSFKERSGRLCWLLVVARALHRVYMMVVKSARPSKESTYANLRFGIRTRQERNRS